MSSFVSMIGQSISPREYVELMYDKDIRLYKGTIHDEYPKTHQGQKYLFTSESTIGSISIQGHVYDSLLLKYDIYKQKLVLEYIYYPVEKRYVSSLENHGRDYSKASYKIDVNPEFIDGFTLGEYEFVSVGKTNIAYPYKYLQTIPSETLDCFIAWRKEYLIDGVNMYFSEERRKVYLNIDGKYTHVSGKGGIIKKLPKTVRPEVKKYCKSIKFNVKKSEVSKFYLLFSFIDDVMKPNED